MWLAAVALGAAACGAIRDALSEFTWGPPLLGIGVDAPLPSPPPRCLPMGVPGGDRGGPLPAWAGLRRLGGDLRRRHPRRRSLTKERRSNVPPPPRAPAPRRRYQPPAPRKAVFRFWTPPWLIVKNKIC